MSLFSLSNAMPLPSVPRREMTPPNLINPGTTVSTPGQSWSHTFIHAHTHTACTHEGTHRTHVRKSYFAIFLLLKVFQHSHKPEEALVKNKRLNIFMHTYCFVSSEWILVSALVILTLSFIFNHRHKKIV